VVWGFWVCVFLLWGGGGGGGEKDGGVLFEKVIAFLIDSVIRTLQNIYNLNAVQNSAKSEARV